MSVTRQSAAKALFLAVRSLDSAARASRLDEACAADPDLRREVESLLAYAADEALAETAGAPPPAPGRLALERFAPGALFAGRYRIVGELGRGGMGKVYRARDLILDQQVALKLVADGRAGLVERLIAEVRLARQVTHPNVCRVFDVGEAAGETFLSMEYVDGEDLRSLLARIGRLPAEKFLVLAQQLCAGLAAAHAAGVLHRDLKPANVMVDGRGNVRITDFGLAMPVDLADGGPLPGGLGTPAYLAPEQWREGRASVASDVYALGLVLHEMATGERVLAGATLADFVQGAVAPAISPRLAELDPRCEAVIRQCLEHDPSDRPRSASAVAAGLPGGDRLELALAAGETPSPDAVLEAERPADRRAGLAVPAALLGIGLLTVLALADRAFPGRAAWRASPREALATRAAVILDDLGYQELGPELGQELGQDAAWVDRAWGFQADPAAGHTDALAFWYRQAPVWLAPSNLDIQDSAFEVTYNDPSPLDAGMVQMLVASDGRLITLKVPPADFDGATPLADVPGGAPPWETLLAVTGFGAAAQVAEPAKVPPFYAEERRAWERQDVDGSMRRLEAAAVGGQIVFADVRPELPPDDVAAGPFDRLFGWAYDASAVLWALATLGALGLAWSNSRAGRGDLLAARRVALLVVGAELVRWLVGSHHLPSPEAEVWRLATASCFALGEGALAWVAYVALEPLARRYWPHALVASTRLLRGRVVDAEVGRALLLGAAAGTAMAIVTLIDRLVVSAAGLVGRAESLVPAQLDVGLAASRWLSSTLQTAVGAAFWAVLGLYLLAALRRLLGRPWAAVTAWIGLLGLVGATTGAHAAVAWATVGLGVAAIGAAVLLRGGLLAYAVALAVQGLLIYSPITRELDSWYARSGLLALAVVAAVGAVGWWLARPRPVPA